MLIFAFLAAREPWLDDENGPSEISRASGFFTDIWIPTGASKKVELTQIQKIIVYSTVALTIILIIAGGILTLWCRKRVKPRQSIGIEQVMLPAPDESFGGEIL
jgi:hypothetical protein